MDFTYDKTESKHPQTSQPETAADKKTFASFGEFAATQRRRTFDARLAARLDDLTADLTGVPAADAEHVEEPNGSGLNFEDEWDKPGAVQQPQTDDGDPFAKYRSGKGMALEAPVYRPLDEAALADFGRVAVREAWTPEFAQGLVSVFAEAAHGERPGENGYDPDRAVSELRHEWGAETEANLLEVGKFVNARPALAAWLDATGIGNSPTALRLLAAAARQPTLMTKSGAEKFIASLKDNKKYLDGDRLENVKAKLAFMVIG